MGLRIVTMKVLNSYNWAKFFTATKWEEVIMLAENNPYIDEAAQTLYEANADHLTEMQCRARRDYYKQKNM